MLNLLLLSSTPFYPQNFGVELVATWSDGMDTTYGTDVAVTPDGWVYLLPGNFTNGISRHFYVLDGRGLPDSGLKLVNVVYDTINYFCALTLWKDCLYVEDYGTGEILVYDIYDRANPRFVTRATPPKGEEGGKGVSSSRLYIFKLPQDTIIVNDWGSIWSISRPDSPVYLANLGKGIGYYELLYPYLYAMNFNPWQLEVHDISDPRNPRLVYVDSTSFYRLNGCLAIYQDSAGNYFMAQGDFWSNQIGIYSLENPERPEPVRIVYNPYDRTDKMWFTTIGYTPPLGTSSSLREGWTAPTWLGFTTWGQGMLTKSSGPTATSSSPRTTSPSSATLWTLWKLSQGLRFGSQGRSFSLTSPRPPKSPSGSTTSRAPLSLKRS